MPISPDLIERLKTHRAAVIDGGGADKIKERHAKGCLLYTSDAADERSSVDLGGRRIIKKNNN